MMLGEFFEFCGCTIGMVLIAWCIRHYRPDLVVVVYYAGAVFTGCMLPFIYLALANMVASSRAHSKKKA